MYINNAWGDSIDTVKHSKPLDHWYSYTNPQLPYNVFKLPKHYSFDITEMRKQVANLNTISIQANANGKKFSKYRGLGFFSRVDSLTPLEDHFVRRDTEYGQVFPDDLHLQDRLPDLIEDDFTQPTEILDSYFQSVFNVFKSPINKASLLDLRAGGWLGAHVDFPYYKTIRLHASIQGCANAWYEINGERFQIPEDGNWYFIDTGKYHSIWNTGPDHRLTLNVNLKVIGDPKDLALSSLL
jgi:hypothetical protein